MDLLQAVIDLPPCLVVPLTLASYWNHQGIPVTDVKTSPFCSSPKSASLAFRPLFCVAGTFLWQLQLETHCTREVPEALFWTGSPTPSGRDFPCRLWTE